MAVSETCSHPQVLAGGKHGPVHPETANGMRKVSGSMPGAVVFLGGGEPISGVGLPQPGELVRPERISNRQAGLPKRAGRGLEPNPYTIKTTDSSGHTGSDT